MEKRNHPIYPEQCQDPVGDLRRVRETRGHTDPNRRSVHHRRGFFNFQLQPQRALPRCVHHGRHRRQRDLHHQG